MIRSKKLVIALVAVLVLLLCVSIGFAALSTTLKVTTNNVTQNALTWDIGFQTGTITGVLTSSNSTASCGTATATNNTISGISPILSAVNDRCAYTFQILNNGSIAGEISTINITKPANTSCTTSGSTMICGDITYKLHYNTATSTSLVSIGDIIDAKSGSSATTKTVVLTIEHTGANASDDDYDQLGFAYTIVYGQH